MGDNEGELTMHISGNEKTVNSEWTSVVGLEWRLSAVLRPHVQWSLPSATVHLECRGLAAHMTVDVKSCIQTRSCARPSVKSPNETMLSVLSAADFHTDNFATTSIAADDVLQVTWSFEATRHCSTPPSRRLKRKFEPEDNDGRDPSPNVVFVVGSEEKRLTTHKELLSFFSPILRRMFDSNFKENVINEIKLADEDPEQFAVFLRFIYRCEDEITTSSVESLARLADYYDVQFVAEQVENWLIKQAIDCDTMLLCRIADNYSYQELMNVCRDLAKNATELKKLMAREDEWNALSIEMRNQLLGACVQTL